MGYTTEFSGKATIEPPLSAAEVEFINLFSDTRRMDCEQGPYFVGRGGMKGQDHEDPRVRDYNRPPSGQPGLWCNWCVSEDGTTIQWNGAEKFYDATDWMRYVIEHFLAGPQPHAAHDVHCLTGNHVVNGVIHAEGEERSDVWDLVITDNAVSGE